MQTINASELKRMIDSNEKFDLINVLPEEDFEKEHIPGSINIPVENEKFPEQVEQRVNGDKDQTLVVYCANTECSASPKAAGMLEDAGFTNIMDFEAGMAGWKEAGYPVESGRVQA